MSEPIGPTLAALLVAAVLASVVGAGVGVVTLLFALREWKRQREAAERILGQGEESLQFSRHFKEVSTATRKDSEEALNEIMELRRKPLAEQERPFSSIRSSRRSVTLRLLRRSVERHEMTVQVPAEHRRENKRMQLTKPASDRASSLSPVLGRSRDRT
jgi:hypothetical protein